MKTILAGLGAVALVACGCGSSNSTSGAASATATFATRADSICNTANAAVTALPASQSMDVSDYQQEYQIELTELRALELLTAPPADAATYAKFLSLGQQTAVIAKLGIADLRAENLTAALSLSNKVTVLMTAINADATKIGLTPCAANPVPSGKG